MCSVWNVAKAIETKDEKHRFSSYNGEKKSETPFIGRRIGTNSVYGLQKRR